MRLVHVIPGVGAGGGAEQSLLTTVPALVAAGHAVHVVILTDRVGFVPKLERAGAIVHDLSHVRGHVGRALALRRLVRDVGADLVQATLFDADVPLQLVAPLLRVPLLVTWPSTPYSPERRREPGVTWWKVQVVRGAEALLGRWSRCSYQAVTPGVATENTRALGTRPDRVSVVERGRPVPSPIDPDRRIRTRDALGIGPGDRLVVSVARHEPQKGVHRLIAALDEIVGADDRVRIVVAGRSGSLTGALERELANRVHADRLQLLGHRNDVPELLEAADLVVSCALNEGAAGALVEAMAARVPIVSTRVIGLSGVLVDHVNARLVSGEDSAELARVVAEVLGDDAVAAGLADRARDLFDERFTLERSGAGLVALYERLVAEASVAAR